MIKIKDLIKENKAQYEIYCDMDSVLTDYDSAFVKIADVKTRDGWEYKAKFGKKKFYDIIRQEGLDFWTEMPWMPDGKKLWKYLQSVADKIYVLSAPASNIDSELCKTGKMIWCKRNLGPYVQVILEENKYKYAAPNHILIDDLDKNIVPWRHHGGIAIQHTSADDTIKKLKALGL